MATNCRALLYAPGWNFVVLYLCPSFDGICTLHFNTCNRSRSLFSLFSLAFPLSAPELLHTVSTPPSTCFHTDLEPFAQSVRSINFAFIMLQSTAIFLLLLSYAHIIACDDNLHARAACSSSFTVCNPKGAATTNEPPIGTGISSLFVDVVDTIDSANLAKRDAGRGHGIIETRASGGSLCCKSLASMKIMVDADPH